MRTVRILPNHLATRIARVSRGLVSKASRVCRSRSPLTEPAARAATPRSIRQATVVPTTRTQPFMLLAKASCDPATRKPLPLSSSPRYWAAMKQTGAKLAIISSTTNTRVRA